MSSQYTIHSMEIVTMIIKYLIFFRNLQYIRQTCCQPINVIWKVLPIRIPAKHIHIGVAKIKFEASRTRLAHIGSYFPFLIQSLKISLALEKPVVLITWPILHDFFLRCFVDFTVPSSVRINGFVQLRINTFDNFSLFWTQLNIIQLISFGKVYYSTDGVSRRDMFLGSKCSNIGDQISF